MRKLYLCESLSDYVLTMADVHDLMGENDIESIQVHEAVPMSMKSFFHCGWVDEPTENEGDTCGRICDGYTPRNGKSGICKHKRRTYREGKKVFVELPKGGRK